MEKRSGLADFVLAYLKHRGGLVKECFPAGSERASFWPHKHRLGSGTTGSA